MRPAAPGQGQKARMSDDDRFFNRSTRFAIKMFFLGMLLGIMICQAIKP